MLVCSTWQSRYISKVLTAITSLDTSKPTLLLGDFNCPDINWSIMTASSHFSSSLCDTLFSLNLVQLVTEPTHIHGNILDIIATNVPQRIVNLEVNTSQRRLHSDHFFITFVFLSKRNNQLHQKNNCDYVLNYSKVDKEGLLGFMEDVYYQLEDVSVLQPCYSWNLIKDIITNACLQFVPKLRIPTVTSPRWFTSEIRHNLNKVKSLRKRIGSSSTPYLINKLVEMENNLTSQMMEAKSTFITGLTKTFNKQPKKLYSYISSLSDNRPNMQYIMYKGCPLSDMSSIVSAFNDFFNSTFTTSDFELPPIWSLSPPSVQLSNIEFTAEDVRQALIALNPNKAMGCDQIHPLILKLCASPLSTPLYNIFRTSLNSAILPDEWKVHKICPIPKKKNPCSVENFRPISLLCIVGKVLERLVYDKIIDFIKGKISKCQHGFLKNRSCLSQLLCSYAFIQEEIENSCAVDAVYLDFKKAFDSVGHNELLFKLWKLGITGPLWLWFKEYLSQRVHYDQRSQKLF